MRISLDTFKHLLPSGKAWRLIIDRRLRQFFDGMAVEPGDAQDFQDGVWNDFRPFETTKLDEWEDQFGLLPIAGGTEQDRRDRLDAEFKALGGQSPRYLQDIVQAAGFPLFIHEWWFPGTNPPIARNPNNLISVDGTGSVVVTQLGRATSQLGGPSASLGKARKLGDLIEDNLEAPVVIPTDPTKYPFFLYWSDATFGDFVQIPAAREEELKTLLLKLCPAQQWIGIFVEFI